MTKTQLVKQLIRGMATEEDKIFDVAIVGGGPGGCYTAYRLHKEFPHNTVVLFEKTQRVGGRLFSVNHHNKVREELGGMRIFPSVMQNLVDLVKACRLDLEPVPLTDQHNIFYYKGERTEKGTFQINGRTPGQMAAACVAAYKKACPVEGAKDPYCSSELSSLNLREFFKKYGGTEEEIDAWFTYSGYDLYPDNIAASIFVKDGELYGSKLSDEQKYVAQGFQELVRRLLEKSKAKVEMGMKVISANFVASQNYYEVQAADFFGRTIRVLARHVVVSLPMDNMRTLVETLDISAERKLALSSVQVFPLFKAFLSWKPTDVWWKDKGFNCGKSTTDLQCRQIHYYDENDLLIYNSGPAALYWKCEFEYDEGEAYKKMFQMVKDVHDMQDLPKPNWGSCLHKFWIDGSHKWKVGVDIYSEMEMICHGHNDGSKIFLCGDAHSGYQGWVVGAIQTADVCYEVMKKTLHKKATSSSTLTLRGE